MQNMRANGHGFSKQEKAGDRLRPRCASARLSLPPRAALLFAVCTALLVFAVASTALSRPAWAEEYTMPQVDIDATVGTDGSLHVVEKRTFSFSGGYSAAWFSLDLPYDGTLEVNGVWMGDPDDIDQNGNVISTPLKRVSFSQDWRTGGGPGVSSYAVDMPRDTIYVFFNSADESCTITLDYTVKNALGVYRDVGELYWSYLTSNWDVDSQNVTLNVRLPVPKGTEVTAGDNVRAWGHGPDDGTVAINADGSITCVCPVVRSGQYAAVRAVFPASWLPDVPSDVRKEHRTELRLDTVLEEEAEWSDTASSQQESWLTVKSAVGGVSMLVLLAAAIVWALVGRERRSARRSGTESGAEDAWRSVLERALPPAVLARSWRFDRESARDMTATVIDLAHRGAIGIERLDDDGNAPEGTPAVPAEAPSDAACRPGVNAVRRSADIARFALVRTPDGSPAADDGLGRGMMALLFDQLAEGADRLPYAGIVRAAEERPHEFLAWTSDWQSALSAEVRKQAFFDAKGMRLQIPVMAVGAVWALLGLAGWYFAHDSFYALAMVPAGVLTALIGANLPRRSQAGLDLDDACESLRAWLREHYDQKAGRPADRELRKELAVYAYLLGVDASDSAEALTAAFDEGWKAARDALRAEVRAR